MTRHVGVLLAMVVAGLMIVGMGSEAHARYRRGGCCGGPIPPSYTYRTTNKVIHRTRYRDVSRTRYVHRTRRIVHVTRIRPIIHIHEVTRVHHHTVAIVRPVHQRVVQYLPARRIVTRSVRNTYDCGCSRY